MSLFKSILVQYGNYLIRSYLKTSQQLGNMEFGRRIAIEKDIERNEASFFSNLGN
jgi:hypothetical protein